MIIWDFYICLYNNNFLVALVLVYVNMIIIGCFGGNYSCTNFLICNTLFWSGSWVWICGNKKHLYFIYKFLELHFFKGLFPHNFILDSLLFYDAVIPSFMIVHIFSYRNLCLNTRYMTSIFFTSKISTVDLVFLWLFFVLWGSSIEIMITINFKHKE